jgi:DNA topoisomerase-1
MPTKKTKKSPPVRSARSRAAANGASAIRANGRNGHNLVIVESPAKARTIAGILGAGYNVTASVGHVRDLPKSKLGVDVDNEFEPHYIVPKEKREVVAKIKDAATKANTIFLATDPDREGEAISWHLVEAAGLEGRPLQRVVFHELTPAAIREAFEHPRDIDTALVDAQQARRILDRLVGYKISPLLWKKVRRGLSAGRVQSAALRMVVEREREILDFVAKEYWTIDALLAKLSQPDAAVFNARLRGKQGVRHFEVNNADDARAVTDALRASSFVVKAVRRRDLHRRPAPPFTTSTLQQDASRRFGFTARRTMALAQQLYEGIELRGAGRVGLITYMRTDSTNLADVAVSEIRSFVAQRYGADFLPSAPRVFRARKGAQEAHEAIRPTSIAREPGAAELRTLNNDQRRLYTLIWQRAVACQMADAVLDSVSVDIDATTPQSEVYQLRAAASAVRFPGFRQLYEEASDNETQSTDDDQPVQQVDQPLPDLEAGDALALRDLKSDQHFTEPPPRYTEATLVKGLEENGIGRPSTYAPILSTIQDRGYVEREARQLKPTELGFVVNDFLIEQFPNVVDLGFTAEMEEDLDEIASGLRPWQPTVRELYNPLNEALVTAADAPVVAQETGEFCPECERPLIRRFGRFGPFFACSGFPECRYTRQDGEEEAAQTDEKCGVCGAAMVVKRGRFGAFLACTRYPECKGTKQLGPDGTVLPTETDEKCDLCGSAMAVKRSRFGPFLACSRFPECKGTKQLNAAGVRPEEKEIGVPCPLDGGEIVSVPTRRGWLSYRCSNHPKCEFTSFQRPMQQVCPECGGMIVAERGRRAKCRNCEWSGPQAAAVERGERPATAAV